VALTILTLDTGMDLRASIEDRPLTAVFLRTPETRPERDAADRSANSKGTNP
jgi:hypothetical protein